MGLFKKKQTVQAESQPRSIINQLAKIVQVQHRRGLSKFVVQLKFDDFFALERELQSKQMYTGTDTIDGFIVHTCNGIPIVCQTIDTTCFSVPVIPYTDEIMTAEEALEYARTCRKKIAKIREV